MRVYKIGDRVKVTHSNDAMKAIMIGEVLKVIDYDDDHDYILERIGVKHGMTRFLFVDFEVTKAKGLEILKSNIHNFIDKMFSFVGIL